MFFTIAFSNETWFPFVLQINIFFQDGTSFVPIRMCILYAINTCSCFASHERWNERCDYCDGPSDFTYIVHAFCRGEHVRDNGNGWSCRGAPHTGKHRHVDVTINLPRRYILRPMYLSIREDNEGEGEKWTMNRFVSLVSFLFLRWWCFSLICVLSPGEEVKSKYIFHDDSSDALNFQRTWSWRTNLEIRNARRIWLIFRASGNLLLLDYAARWY